MFQYRLTNQITGTVEQVHFNKKIYDTTDGRYNRGVFIVTEPGYYQFSCALAAESTTASIGWYLQVNRSTVATGLAVYVSISQELYFMSHKLCGISVCHTLTEELYSNYSILYTTFEKHILGTVIHVEL